MSEPGEKRRKKNKDAEQPSDSKTGRRRDKNETPLEDIEAGTGGNTERKPKRAKKAKVEQQAEHTEIDMTPITTAPPRKTKKKKPAEAVEKVEEDMQEISSDEEVKVKPKDVKKGKSGGPINLKQSRKWDQEDLEVVVPDDDMSDEAPQGGSGEEYDGNRRVGPTPVLNPEEVGSMDETEKEGLDWLTRVMPDEVLRNIYSNLEPVEVDKTALVCHRLNNLVQERDVWAIYKPEWGYVTAERFGRARSRAGYASCYNYEMEQRQQARDRKELQEWNEYLEAGSEWAKGFMTLLLFNRSVDYFSLFCLILGTCFAAARCQEAITWNWRVVLIPLYIPLFQIILTPLAYDLCRIYFTSDNINDITDNLTIWHALYAKFRSLRVICYAANLALVIFFILLMVKLNDNLDAIPAGVVIIPLLLFLVIAFEECLFGIMIGESYSETSYSVDRFFLAGASFLAIPTLIMIVIKLDNVVTTNWVVILVPFYALVSWFLFVPFTLFLLYNCWYSLRGYSRLSDNGGGGTAFFIWLMVSGMGSVPILTWVLLIALNLDGYYHRSWPVVFIPLFVGEGLFFFGCLFTDFIVWLD